MQQLSSGSTAQVAACIGDGMLVSEGAISFHDCAAPLLAARAEHGFLKKALAACHVTMAEVKAEYAASNQVDHWSLAGHLHSNATSA